MIDPYSLKIQAENKEKRLPGFWKCLLGFGDKERSIEKIAELYIRAGNCYSVNKNSVVKTDSYRDSIEAIECYQRAINCYNKIPNGLYDYDCVGIFEKMARVSESSDDAIFYYKQAIVYCEKDSGSNFIKREQIFSKLAGIYEGLKDYTNALKYTEYSVRMIEARAMADLNKASLVDKYCKKGKFELYLNHLDESIKNFELANDTDDRTFTGEYLYCVILLRFLQLANTTFVDLVQDMNDILENDATQLFMRSGYYREIQRIIDCIGDGDYEQLASMRPTVQSSIYFRNKEITEVSNYIITSLSTILKNRALDLT